MHLNQVSGDTVQAPNPADGASCGFSADKFLSSERWFNGPAFLKDPEEEWPSTEIAALAEDDAEVKNERPIFALMPDKPDKLHEIPLRYSSWKLLQRTVVWLLKFKEYLRCLKNKDTVGINRLKFLTTAHLEKAKIAIVKLIQRQVYAEEIHDLEHKGNVRC